MGNRLYSDDLIRFSRFSLVIAFDYFVVANSKICRFNKSPCQVFIAIFAIDSPFLFTVSIARSADTTAIKGITPWLVKALSTPVSRIIVRARILPIPSMLLSHKNLGCKRPSFKADPTAWRSLLCYPARLVGLVHIS
jgi:hypothetical protein